MNAFHHPNKKTSVLLVPSLFYLGSQPTFPPLLSNSIILYLTLLLMILAFLTPHPGNKRRAKLTSKSSILLFISSTFPESCKSPMAHTLHSLSQALLTTTALIRGLLTSTPGLWHARMGPSEPIGRLLLSINRRHYSCWLKISRPGITHRNCSLEWYVIHTILLLPFQSIHPLPPLCHPAGSSSLHSW